MARPRVDPLLRFRDVVPYWQYVTEVFDPNLDPLVRLRKSSPGQAIALMHRLNLARAAMRGDQESHTWDSFVVRAIGSEVTIHHRAKCDFTIMYDAAGQPITDWKPHQDTTIADAQKAYDELVKGNVSVEEAIKRADMLRHGPHRIDPSKPLLDDSGG